MTGSTVVVRCAADFLEELDEYRRKQSDIPTRAEVLRRLAKKMLTNQNRPDESGVRAGAGA
jgi:hypothetical protein